jgi:hypothetical protein
MQNRKSVQLENKPRDLSPPQESKQTNNAVAPPSQSTRNDCPLLAPAS